MVLMDVVCVRGMEQIVTALLNAGAAIHAKDVRGRTALHIAAAAGTPTHPLPFNQGPITHRGWFLDVCLLGCV